MFKNSKRFLFMFLCATILAFLFIDLKEASFKSTSYEMLSEETSPPLAKEVIAAENNNSEDRELPLLDGEDFLKEHLYGQWRFSERIFTLDQSVNMYFDAYSNFSDIGVEEIKKAVVILFAENAIQHIGNVGQTGLSSIRDMYLYAMWGGFNLTHNPIYSIEKLDNDLIHLYDLYYDKGRTVEFPEARNFYKVTYSLDIDDRNNASYSQIFTWNFLNLRDFEYILYIDPNDTETIYLEFCGLWKMERDNINYSTMGKSEH